MQQKKPTFSPFLDVWLIKLYLMISTSYSTPKSIGEHQFAIGPFNVYDSWCTFLESPPIVEQLDHIQLNHVIVFKDWFLIRKRISQNPTIPWKLREHTIWKLIGYQSLHGYCSRNELVFSILIYICIYFFFFYHYNKTHKYN